MRIRAGLEKIVYGSDFPASPNQKEVIDFLKYERVPRILRKNGFPDWTYAMRARVLGLNAAGILGLHNERIERIRAAISEGEERLYRLEWSPEALQRAESIPPFIRRSAVRTIEDYARRNGISRIDPAVMDAARKWGGG